MICPATLKLTWQNEFQKWTNISTQIIDSKTDFDLTNEVFIINYDIVTKRLDDLLQLKSQVLILDEAHYTKNRKSQRTKSIIELSKHFKHIIALTGTPILNRPIEIYNILKILDTANFGNWWFFAKRYCLPPEAPILLSDLTEKPIKDIKIGDEIVGWKKEKPKYNRSNKLIQRRLIKTKVLDIIVKQAPLQKVIFTDNKEIICTPDHKWLNFSGKHKNYEYIEAREGHDGGGKFTVSTLTEIFNIPKFEFKNTENFQKGYLLGCFDGDGSLSQHIKSIFSPLRSPLKKYSFDHHHIGFTSTDIELIKEVINLLINFGFNANFIINNSKPKTYKIQYRLKIEQSEKTFNFLTQLTSYFNTDNKDFWAGWLGGIYDTEGCGSCISQSRKANPLTFNRIINALSLFNFKYGIPKTSKAVNIRILGGREEFFRFIGIASPILKRKWMNNFYNYGGKFKLKAIHFKF